MRYQCRVLFATTILLLSAMGHAGEPLHPRGSMTLAIAGDLIGPYSHRIPLEDPGFAKVADLFRGADVGFANVEGSIFDLWNFPGYPAAENGGGRPLQASVFATDVRNMGLSLVSKANNHTTDFGDRGLVETLQNLYRAGIVVAGAGLSESAARAPAYLNTPNGVAALVATASTFPPMSVAADGLVAHHIMTNPRPGISALHVSEVRLVPPALFASLREAAGPIGLSQGAYLRISDQLFAPGKRFGTRWEMERTDEDAILGALDEAKTRADLVIFSIHAHETAGDDDPAPPVPFEPMVLHKANEAPSPDDPRPTSFEVELFHAAVDHGADVVIRHGPHVIDGVNIYKGKPIFYGVGSLFLDFRPGLSYSPAGEKFVAPNSYYETIVPVCVFRSHRLQMCKVYPIAIDPDAGPRSGDPSIAEGAQAQAILERFKELSAAFGTKVEIANGVALVHPHG